MDNHLRYSEYTLPNGRKVYLTQRPDVVTHQKEVFDFIQEKNIKIRLQYTDDWVDFPPVVPWHWFNWVPSEEPTIESIYASTVTINQFNKNNPIDFSIWMHCDSSSMRAPTYFGLFLHAVYPDKVKEIAETLKVSDNFDYNYALHSTPDKYAGYTLDRSWGVKEFIRYWNIDEVAAYDFYMSHDMEFRWGKK